MTIELSLALELKHCVLHPPLQMAAQRSSTSCGKRHKDTSQYSDASSDTDAGCMIPEQINFLTSISELTHHTEAERSFSVQHEKHPTPMNTFKTSEQYLYTDLMSVRPRVTRWIFLTSYGLSQ